MKGFTLLELSVVIGLVGMAVIAFLVVTTGG